MNCAARRDHVVRPDLGSMTHTSELLHLALMDSPLDKQGTVTRTVAGMVDGLLGAHPAIEEAAVDGGASPEIQRPAEPYRPRRRLRFGTWCSLILTMIAHTVYRTVRRYIAPGKPKRR